MTNRDKINRKYLVVKRRISFIYKADILLTKLIIRGVIDVTNREDKFNKMSNAELADILSRTLGADTCKFCCYTKEKCLGKSCTEGIEKWLNSPCEPENPPADNKAEKLSKERVENV